MSFNRIFTGVLFCIALIVPAFAQKHEMDPDVKNYKLSMERIKAYDSAVHKLYAQSKSNPALKESFKAAGDKKTLNEMIAAVEGNIVMTAVIKSSGLNARDFCLIPMSIMAAGSGYMIQNQYKKDGTTVTTADNIAFYGAHKDEIEKITSTWGDPGEK